MHINGFIVYALCDARTHQIRYVGASERGLVRPVGISGYKGHPELHAWLRDLAVCGSEHVVLVLATASTVEQLHAAEAYWIDLGRHFGWPLLNRQGKPKTLEAEQLLPEGKRWSAKNWRRDPEVRARLAAAREKRGAWKRNNRNR